MSICKKIYQETEELFECSPFREYTRIETPFLYPDGDIIDLFYKKSTPYELITDLGGVCDWLGLQTIAKTRTDKQEQQIEYICDSYRVEFRKGEFFIDLNKGNETRNLTEAIFDLSQAMIRISGLWFLQIDRSKNQIIDDIESFIKINDISYVKNKPFEGSSGNIWKPNFYAENKSEGFLIYVLSTDKKNSTSNILYRIVAAWHDLEYLKTDKKKTEKENIEFISLFDDRYDVWKASDRKMLRDFSTIKKFSNKNDLRNTLIGIS